MPDLGVLMMLLCEGDCGRFPSQVHFRCVAVVAKRYFVILLLGISTYCVRIIILCILAA